jgi:DNA-binding IscR family transcriptional regulator
VEKNYSGCVDIRKCVFKNIWQQVAEATAGIIDSVTFEDLRQCIKQSQQVLSYII